jgi:hypothetical protein
LPNRSPVRFSLSAGKNAGKIRKSGIELLNGGRDKCATATIHASDGLPPFRAPDVPIPMMNLYLGRSINLSRNRTSRKPYPLTMLRSALCAASHWVAKPSLAWRRTRRNHVHPDSGGHAERNGGDPCSAGSPITPSPTLPHCSLGVGKSPRDHAAYRRCRLIRGARRMVTYQCACRRFHA